MMMIRSPRILMRLAAVALALLTTGAVSAQSAPATVSGLESATTIGSDARRKIAAYVDYYGRRLMDAGERPADVYAIRGRLVGPLNTPAVSEVFRSEYARTLLPLMDDVIRNGSPHLSVNAVIVIGRVGNERSLAMLMEHASARAEPRRQVRLAAARGIALFLSELEAGKTKVVVKPKRITAAGRALLAAIREEPDAATLRYQLQAILGCVKVAPEEARSQLRDQLVKAIEATAEHAATGGPTDHDPIDTLAAVYPVMNEVRIQYLKLDPSSQREYGKRLAPTVRRMLEVADTHWAQAQERPQNDGQPAKIILLGERLLSTIDSVVRSSGTRPDTNLAEAWKTGDADRYRLGLERWAEVLQSPPY